MPSHRTSPSSRRADPVKDDERNLREALNSANTDLNKAIGDKDRFETSCSQLKKLVSESQFTIQDLRSQVQTTSKDRDSYKEKYKQSKEDYAALGENWLKRYAELEARYDSLFKSYNDLKSTAATTPTYGAHSNNATTALPDRSRDSWDDRDRERERDRGRGRESDRERERREKKEAKAEKERLSKRFENRPPTSKRRSSFIDGRGSGGRSASANPASRTSSGSGTTGRPAPPYGNYTSSTVPRTPDPRAPSGHYSSSGSSATFDDDYEDGNYHAYPIQR